MNEIEIIGKVEFKNGDKIIRARNHFVDEGAKLIVSFLGAKDTYGYYGNYPQNAALPTWSWSLYLGSDTSTATTHDMTALVSPIGASPGTAPNSKDGYLSNPSAGVWRVVYSATWDAGTVSGTVGEAALYLCKAQYFAFEQTKWAVSYSHQSMVSRLASADGAFSAFVINTSKPLTATWVIELSST